MQNPVEKARAQLIVVEILNGDCPFKAVLSAYEFQKRVLGPFNAVIGLQGIAQDKREGDGKTPLGIYPLLTVFGKEDYRTNKMPFISVHEHLEAIDDPLSKHYNTIVDRREVDVDWKSSEKMKEVGFLYDLGIVIGYNTKNPIPGKGSCIFMHIWRAKNQGTAGCVAMSLASLQAITKWLSFEHSPSILIQQAQ